MNQHHIRSYTTIYYTNVKMYISSIQTTKLINIFRKHMFKFQFVLAKLLAKYNMKHHNKFLFFEQS
jgi:hypothetical protein